MTQGISESAVEEAALTWFAELGYALLHGPDIAPDEPAAERASYKEVVLAGRLKGALTRLNLDSEVEIAPFCTSLFLRRPI